jgi:ATP/maltotriose-dependent transcriptional regulator MalT/DNA-binding SARP family transcriptional activator
VAARSPALAKLSRPRLFDALARPRLYALLDQGATRPIVWICAPPGAGKTTLVASYVEARDRPCLWYHLDAADGDPATFVHYMRIAAQPLAGKRAASLPQFAADPQQDLGRFLRGFSRDLFSVLPENTVIVLDNFHDARATSAQVAAFAQGLEEVPEGITVVVTSRTDPPPEFSRLVASLSIARIDPDALRFTSDEARSLLGAQQLDHAVVEQVRTQSDGWVAALVLIREHLSRPGAAIEESLGEGRDAIFQYFAGEIFNRAKPANQRALMLTAIPPSITQAEAIELTGTEDAPRVLDYLFRRHLFIERRRGAQTTYHYQALFREFLLEQGAMRLSGNERRTASARAAALLQARGQVHDALALYRAAGEFEAMRTLVLAGALDWARQGRAQALSDSIEALPTTMRAADPWLEYWFGRAWIFVEPERGRPALARAYEAFVTSGDLRGQALALNTIVTGCYYEWANFVPLDRWLPEFDRLLGADAPPLDPASELRARAAYLIVLLFRRPEDDAMEACARRLDDLIDAEPDLNARMMAASTLFNYFNWKAKGDAADALVARIAPVLSRPEVTPLMQLWWRTHLSFWHYINGRYDESATVIAAARDIAGRYGLDAYLFEIDHAEASALITKGAYAEARTLIEATERRMSPARRMDWAYFHNLRANLEQRLGHFMSAVQAAERAVQMARETGLPIMQVPHFLVRLAHCRMAAGDEAAGMQALDEAIGLATGVDRRHFEDLRDLLESCADLSRGQVDRAAATLARVLADYRSRRQVVFLRARPELAARLADFALERGIETDYVRLLIARNGLVAPADATDRWPFPLRIRALGGFTLTRNDEPMRFTGKTQQRPLDLLKLLVALGGHEVDSQQLTAALWPDADGAAAKTSFDTTLFRLRKLIDVDDALTLAGGKLSLSADRCWTDVRALEALLASVDRVGSRDAATLARRILERYAGPLLGTEDEPWIAKPRDALRARFIRALARLGGELEQALDWTAAADLYRRGLEADNLAEPLYRGLMRSLAAVGDHAEALNAFRRCRELLSVVLGLKPSPETEAIHREVVARSPR